MLSCISSPFAEAPAGVRADLRREDGRPASSRSTWTTAATWTSGPSRSSAGWRASRSRPTRRRAGAGTSSIAPQHGQRDAAAPSGDALRLLAVLPQQLGQPRRQPAPGLPRRRRAHGGRRLPPARSPTCTTWARPSARGGGQGRSASSTSRAGRRPRSGRTRRAAGEHRVAAPARRHVRGGDDLGSRARRSWPGARAARPSDRSATCSRARASPTTRGRARPSRDVDALGAGASRRRSAQITTKGAMSDPVKCAVLLVAVAGC